MLFQPLWEKQLLESSVVREMPRVSPTPETDQAVVSPGTLQVEVNTTMYDSCLWFVHPTVCQTLSPTLRIQSSTASFTGLHPG